MRGGGKERTGRLTWMTSCHRGLTFTMFYVKSFGERRAVRSVC